MVVERVGVAEELVVPGDAIDGRRLRDEVPQVATHLGQRAPLAGVDAPFRGRPQVLELGRDRQGRVVVHLAVEQRCETFGEREEVAGMSDPCPVGLAGLSEPVDPELAERLQQPVAAPAGLVDDERAVHQPGDAVHDVAMLRVGGQPPPPREKRPGEDGEAPEDALRYRLTGRTTMTPPRTASVPLLGAT